MSAEEWSSATMTGASFTRHQLVTSITAATIIHIQYREFHISLGAQHWHIYARITSLLWWIAMRYVTQQKAQHEPDIHCHSQQQFSPQ